MQFIIKCKYISYHIILFCWMYLMIYEKERELYKNCSENIYYYDKITLYYYIMSSIKADMTKWSAQCLYFILHNINTQSNILYKNTCYVCWFVCYIYLCTVYYKCISANKVVKDDFLLFFCFLLYNTMLRRMLIIIFILNSKLVSHLCSKFMCSCKIKRCKVILSYTLCNYVVHFSFLILV
jgi:hypothetical protein